MLFSGFNLMRRFRSPRPISSTFLAPSHRTRVAQIVDYNPSLVCEAPIAINGSSHAQILIRIVFILLLLLIFEVRAELGQQLLQNARTHLVRFLDKLFKEGH